MNSNQICLVIVIVIMRGSYSGFSLQWLEFTILLRYSVYSDMKGLANRRWMMVRVSIGQDSHRFDFDNSEKKLILGGIVLEGTPLMGNSDADVVLHALTNAVSGVTGVNILGAIADKMCLEDGVTDSSAYLVEAMKHLKGSINHVSFSIECLVPKLSAHIPRMKAQIAQLLSIDTSSIGITATTGEGLTDFGLGLGIQCFCVLTVSD